VVRVDLMPYLPSLHRRSPTMSCDARTVLRMGQDSIRFCAQKIILCDYISLILMLTGEETDSDDVE